MEIYLEHSKDVAIVTLKGRLNVSTTAELEQAFNGLFKDGKTKVLVECVELEYISSAGLRVLLAFPYTPQGKKPSRICKYLSFVNRISLKIGNCVLKDPKKMLKLRAFSAL